MNDLIKLSHQQKNELRSICKEYNLSNKWFNCFTTKIRCLTLYQTYDTIINSIINYFKEDTHHNIFLFSRYLESKCLSDKVLPQIKKEKKEISSGFLF